jgi:hypothetical protein
MKFVASKNIFLQKIKFILGKLDILEALGFCLLPLPHFPLCLIQPLWGLNSHLLGEGRKANHQVIIISNYLKFFHLFYPCISFIIFKVQELFSSCISWLLISIGLFFRGGYVDEASHSNVGFHP